MRIVFVIPYFHDAWAYGGQPRSAFEMARGLVQRGHSVKVLTTDSAGDHRLSPFSNYAVRTVEGIETRCYRNLSNSLAFRYRLFFPPAFFKAISHEIEGSDVVHIHELRSFMSVGAAFAARRQSIPFVLSPHGGLRHLGRHASKALFDVLWGRKILRRAAALIVVSPVEEREAREEGIKTRMFSVPNGLLPADFDSLPAEGTFRNKYALPMGRLILFLGRLHFVKGADLLVEAFAKLCRETGNRAIHLVLAGPDDGQERDLRGLVERQGIRERVTFTGYLDQTEKLQGLIDSSLVVVPSRSEVFAITAIEALMCSRPVLLSSVCGLHPAPGERNGVRRFEHNSVEDLTAQLRSALNEPRLPEAARRGRDFARREFSTASVSEALERAYQAIGKVNG